MGRRTPKVRFPEVHDRDSGADAQRRDLIQQYGWIVMNVHAEQPWSYTIGVWKTFGEPELLVGAIDETGGTCLCNEYGNAIKTGARFSSGQTVDSWIEGRPVYLLQIDDEWKPWFLGTAVDDYDSVAFPALQAVWSDLDGHFPWESGWQREEGIQQFLLGSPQR